MATVIKGGCLCGAVRYECEAEPIMAGHCQRRDCQKDSGTGHSSHIMFPKAAVQISGPTKEYRNKADSGNTVTRGFCTNCGSPIYGSSSGFPDMISVRAASLDDPGLFRPQMVVYTVRRQAWDQMDPGLPKFERMPPMQQEQRRIAMAKKARAIEDHTLRTRTGETRLSRLFGRHRHLVLWLLPGVKPSDLARRRAT